ncbi:MAG: hypothetical protein INH41_00300 [Myxococcaceae bacterium]|jgi:hypothetical protein|nr:hypothetical protein [Myxococcaceae bacterium]MCA3010816.1 hypothetical protein [Myxococcaceae bacterium]
MRINGRSGAEQVAAKVKRGSAETALARRERPAAVHRVDVFEATTRDVPVAQAGTVRQQRQALVTGDLGGVRQGATNACGPIALWLALGQFGRASADWRQLDAELRPWGLGTSPGVLVEAARERGLQAELYNRGTFDELERETRLGRAVLVMVDVGGYERPNGDMRPGDGRDLETHWMRLTRAWRDSLGRRWVEYENPWGTREVLRYEAFEALWRDQRLGGVPTGYDRAFILIDRAKARPLPTTSADDVIAVRSVTDGAQTFARGVDALLRGQPLVGAGRLVGGALSTLFGAAGAALALPGAWLQRAGDALLTASQEALSSGGPRALAGLVAGAAGLVATGVGAIAGALGNAVGFVGQALSAMVQGALGALGRLFG